MKVVMGLCETVFVLDHGEKIAEGPPGVIQARRARHRSVLWALAAGARVAGVASRRRRDSARGWPLIHDAPLMHYIAWRIGEGARAVSRRLRHELPRRLPHPPRRSSRCSATATLAWRAVRSRLARASTRGAPVASRARRRARGRRAAARAALRALSPGGRRLARGTARLPPVRVPARRRAAASRARSRARGARVPLGWAGLALGVAHDDQAARGRLLARAPRPSRPPARRAALARGGGGDACSAPASCSRRARHAWLARVARRARRRVVDRLRATSCRSTSGRARRRSGSPSAARLGWALGSRWSAPRLAAGAVDRRRARERARAVALLGVAATARVHFVGPGQGLGVPPLPARGLVRRLPRSAPARPGAGRRRHGVPPARLGASRGGLGCSPRPCSSRREGRWTRSTPVDRRQGARASRRSTRDLGRGRRPGATVQVLDTTEGGIHALLRLRACAQPTRFIYDFHFFHDVGDAA